MKNKIFKSLMLVLLLTAGVGNAWAWNEVWLRGDMYGVGWSSGISLGNSGNGSAEARITNGKSFKFFINNHWCGKDDNQTLKEGDSGCQIQSNGGGNITYNGNGGIICFHAQQDGKGDETPWVWLTRSDVYLKHPWNNGDWTWKRAEDNSNGTYTVIAQYGGTSAANYGTKGESDGDGWEYLSGGKVTVIGNPQTGDPCEFILDVKGENVHLTVTKLNTITIKFLHNGNTTGWTIQGVNKYPTSATQNIQVDGPWVVMTFTNVLSVSNIDLAYSNGDWDYLRSKTLTEDKCYNWDGTENETCTAGATYTVTIAKNEDGYGTVSQASVGNVASGTRITFGSTGNLVVGSTNVTATPAAATAQYTYSFDGWTSSDYTTGGTVTADGTVMANFTRTARTYNITYKDQGGGDYSGSNGSSLTANYTFGTGVAKLVAGVKAGYTFGGWFDNSDCTGIAVTSIANDATGDKTLYAKWEAVADAWSMWYWSDRAIKIGDFTDNRDGTYSLTMTLTNTNALTLWFQNNSQHYIAPSSSLTTEQNLSTTGDGRFEWHTDPREKEYTLTIRKENGTWKVKAESENPPSTTWYVKWNNGSRSSAQMTEVESGHYKSEALTLGEGESIYFNLYDGTTSYTDGAQQTATRMVVNTQYVYAAMQQSVYITCNNGSYYVHVNTKTGKFWLEEANPYPVIKIAGSWDNNWGTNRTMTRTGNVYTYTYENINGGQYEFGFRHDDNTDWYRTNTSGVSYSSRLRSSGDSYYNFVVRFAEQSNVTVKLTYTNENSVYVDVEVSKPNGISAPASLQVAGSWNWGSGNVTMTKNGNVFTATKNLTGDTEYTFNIKKDNVDYYKENSVGVSAASSTIALTPTGSFPDFDFKFTPTETADYVFTVTWTEALVTIDVAKDAPHDGWFLVLGSACLNAYSDNVMTENGKQNEVEITLDMTQGTNFFISDGTNYYVTSEQKGVAEGTEQLELNSGNTILTYNGFSEQVLFTYNTSTMQLTLSPAKRRFYLKNDANWKTPYVYMWNSDDTNVKNGEWPGAKMTSTVSINCTEYYVVEIDNSALFDMFIFSNNGSSQTANLTIAEYLNYYYNNANASKTAIPTAVKHNLTSSVSNATIKNEDGSAWTNLTLYEGSVVKFKVEVADGYVLDGVKVGDDKVTADSKGVYSYTMKCENVAITTQTHAVVEYRIMGRFRVYNDAAQSVENSMSGWVTDFSNSTISFVYDIENSIYVLHTYCTPAQLCANLSGQGQYFYVSSATQAYKATGKDNYLFTSSVTSATLTTSGINMKFDGMSDDTKYVVLYWNEATKVLSYQLEPKGAAPVIDNVADAYYVYIGTSYNLPTVNTASQEYVWTGSFVNGTGQFNLAKNAPLGDYELTCNVTANSITTSKTVHVYVYRYYVKNAWNWSGTASTSNPSYNAAWVWQPMTANDAATMCTFTGQAGQLVTSGANLCWDYTYDWTGVYQTDNNASCNFHPGLDNDSKQGYWGNGATECPDDKIEATTGATTWKPMSLTAGTVYDFVYTESLNGSSIPSNNKDLLTATGTEKTIRTITFNTKVNHGNDADAGYITTTAGSKSPIKVLDGTTITFEQHSNTGYTFVGWYSDEEHTALLSTEDTYTEENITSDYTIYAYYTLDRKVSVQFHGGATTLMEDNGNGIFSYTYIENIVASSAQTVVFTDNYGNTWNHADQLEHCTNSVVESTTSSTSLNVFSTQAIKSVTFTFTYAESPAKPTLCVSVEYADVATDWYLVSVNAGGSIAFSDAHPFNKAYRGMQGVYYQVYTFTANQFSSVYKGTSGSNEHYCSATNTPWKFGPVGTELATSNNQSLTNSFSGTYYAVIDTRVAGKPRVWYETPEPSASDYHTISVTNGAHGEFTLTDAVTGFETTKFANKDKWLLTVTPTDGYAVIITVDGVEVSAELNVSTTGSTNTATYTYTGTMDESDHAVAISYEQLTPIRIFVKRVTSRWDPSQNPMIHWSADNSNWTGFSTDVRVVKVAGFKDWYEFTFDQNVGGVDYNTKTVIWWQALNGVASTSSTYQHDFSDNQKVTVYDEALCYNIAQGDEYKHQPVVSTLCPMVLPKLNIVGGDMIGSTASLTASSALDAEWKESGSYTVQYTYYYKIGSGDWVKIDETKTDGSQAVTYLVTEAGDYQYKVHVALHDGSGEVFGAIDDDIKKITVGEATLNVDLSTNATSTNANVNVTPSATGVAVGAQGFYCFELLNSSKVVVDDITFTETSTGSGVWRFTTPNEVGTYYVRVYLKVGTDCEHAKTITYVDEEISVGAATFTITLKVSDTDVTNGSANVNDVIAISTETNLTGTLKYTFTVKPATSGSPTSLGSNQSASTSSYTLPFEDTYTFTAYVTNGATTLKASATVTVGAKTMYIHYPFGCVDPWPNREMTYNGNGVYVMVGGYCPSKSSDYRAYIGTSSVNPATTNPRYTAKIIGTPQAGQDALFEYNSLTDEFKIIAAGTTFFRIKSETNKGTFYSNEVISSATGDELKVSFYATTAGTLTMEKQVATDPSWSSVDAGSVSVVIPENGVYVGSLAISDGHATLNSVTPYTGTYYIYGHFTKLKREEMASATEGAVGVGPWKGDMTKFEKISPEEFYDHYWVHWFERNNSPKSCTTNVFATVGNLINSNLAIPMPEYDILKGTSVRFAYDPSTNYFSRAMLYGSTAEADFLQLYGENLYQDVTVGENHSRGTAASDESSSITMDDGSDWVYTKHVFVTKNSSMKLYANYGGTTKYLLNADGLASYALPLLGAKTSGDITDFRFYIAYDFKTNRVLAGWHPDESIEIENNLTVDADMIIYRDALGTSNPDMFRFAEAVRANHTSVNIIKRLIFALDIDKKNVMTAGNFKGTWAQLYQVTLPFPVKLTSVSGIPGYGTNWTLQEYNGKMRAVLGAKFPTRSWWANMVYSESSVLYPYEGYVVQLHSKDFVEIEGEAHKYLYFPSETKEEGWNITDVHDYANVTYNEFGGTNAGTNNWRMVGVPGFMAANFAGSAVSEAPVYYYAWDGQTGEFTVYDSEYSKLRPTTNYFIQYAGTVDWTNNVGAEEEHNPFRAPERAINSCVAAKSRYGAPVSSQSYCLQLLDNEDQKKDQTFVKLRSDATMGYDSNKDLQKEFGADAQIYSVVNGINYAGDVLPDTVTIVPIGISLPESSYYSIQLAPSNSGNQKAYLYDAIWNRYTDLSDGESYGFDGTTGKEVNRFSLVLGYKSPEVVTSIEQTTDKNSSTLTATIVGDKIIVLGYENDDLTLYDAAGRLVYASSISNGNAIPAPSTSGVYLVRCGSQVAKLVIRQ